MMLFAVGFVSGIATLVLILSWAAWSAWKPTKKRSRPPTSKEGVERFLSDYRARYSNNGRAA